MTKLIVIEHDAESGNSIEREMTDLELADWESKVEKEKTEAALKQKNDEENATAKQVILNRLGITAEEAALLVK